MAGATFSRNKVWDAEILTASDLNSEFDNILNNLTPAGIDDESASDAAAQATKDPYPGGSLLKATSLQEEIQQLRYLIKQITGESQWYIDPDVSLATAATSISPASESAAGIAEIATQAEVDAGAFDDKIITPKKLYSTPGIYRRNAIINGAMEIAQRGTSFPSAANGQFIVDRFKYVKGGTSAVHTVGQSSDAPTGVGLSNSALLDCTTADTSIDATDYSGILYFVEGYDFARFKDRQAVLSFYVKAPKAGAYCVSFMGSGNDRSYVAEYTVNQPNAWEFKSIPITFNYTGGTWNYTNGRGVGIYWMVACGSTYHTTPGAWQTGIFLATANQVNACDSTDNDFKLTGVQLEVGSAATPFEHRPYAEELALCQRYYCKTFPYDTPPAQNTGLTASALTTHVASGTSWYMGARWSFPQRMRVAPTITTYSTSDASANWWKLPSDVSGGGVAISAIGETGVTLTTSNVINSTEYAVIHVTADAEL